MLWGGATRAAKGDLRQMSSGKEPALNPTNVLRITLAVLLVLRFGGTFASYAL